MNFQPYLARAFFPGGARATQEVLIDGTSFSDDGEEPTLVGILRHELGHVLGFRHEHTRPESGGCYEDQNWRALTDYDHESVMHYPHCPGGTTIWTLDVTARDGEGAAALYGLPGSGTTRAPRSGSSHRVLVPAGDARVVGPFIAEGGSTFVASTRALFGNADLYVRFGDAPTEQAFDCRPFDDGGNEACSLDVPAGGAEAYVLVRGETDAAVELEIAFSGDAYLGAHADDFHPVMAVANEASLETLDARLDSRAASAIVAARPLVTFADLDALEYVGPTALVRLRDIARVADRGEDALVLDLVNDASFEVLDDEVGLDRRAAVAIVEARAERAIETIEELDAVYFVGAWGLATLRVYVSGGDVPAVAGGPLDEAQVLEVANGASFDELDLRVGLTPRTAQSIVDLRPFATLPDLDAAPFVGPSTLESIRAYGRR